MTITKDKSFKILSSASLHIIAMILMLFDHLAGSWVMPIDWFNAIGRIAFPIFAFLNVEGHFHTSDQKKYLKRLAVFALISEIPFDMMTESVVFYPFHQNVIVLFLLGQLIFMWLDKIRSEYKSFHKYFMCGVAMLVGFLASYLVMADYNGPGMLMLYTFYWLREDKALYKVLQLAFMWYINCEMLKGYFYPVTVFGHYFEIQQQGLACLALPLIWMYSGKRGLHSKAFQYFCYAFYPAHMLILALIVMFR